MKELSLHLLDVAKNSTAAGARNVSITLEEGAELRRGGVTRPILLFGYTPPTAARCLAAGKLTQGVFSGEYAAALGAEALRAGVQVDFHLMVDSGMGRLGLRPGEPDSLRQAAERLMEPFVRAEGLWAQGVEG